MQEYVFNGKKYGWIADTVFKKRVNSRRHKMRMLNAYGIEKVVVDDLDSKGITEIRIKEEDTGTVFSITYPEFIEKRFLKDFGTPQYFIQIKHLKINTPTVE